MEKPDWMLWLYKPSVTLEECVCLSLDSEPETEQRVPFSGGVHIYRYWDAEFNGVLNTEEGKERLEKLRKHFDAGSQLLPPCGGQDYRSDYQGKLVDLLDFAKWACAMKWKVPREIDVTPKPALAITEPVPVVSETKEQRENRRLQACIDAGLPMNDKAALSRLPDGVGNVADCENVTRQAFSTDVKAALKRRESALREGSTVHRA